MDTQRLPEITGPREFWYLCWNLTFSRVKTILRRAFGV